MPAYDSANHSPPAPVAEVTLRDLSTGRTCAGVRLLLDTGADVTLLPRPSLTNLGVAPLPDESYQLIGFDAHSSQAVVVELELLFLRRAFRGRFLVIDQEEGILGRDILNHLAILLDGPRSEWVEQTPP